MSRREKREQEEREEKERKKKEKEAKKKKNTPKKRSSNKKKTTEKKVDNKRKDKQEKEIKEIEEIEIPAQTKEKRKENSKSKRKKKKKKNNIVLKILKTILKVFLIIMLVIILLLGCFLGWLGFKYDWNLNNMLKGGAKQVALFVTGQTEEDVANLDPLYCLVLGVSTDEGLLLTDTIILCAYYPRTQEASMLSIPRDTFVGRSEATAGGYDKINALYQAGGGGEAGAQKVLDAVEKLTGLEINNYLAVKNDGLIQIVDAIGGVDFTVPIDMNYDDPGQKLYIHLKQGYQHIDGAKAEQLLRFRHNNDGSSYPASYGDNDIGRMRTQRDFITETIKQTIQFKNVTKINDLIKIAFDNIETNLDLDYVLKYSPAAIEFDVAALQSADLPGTPAILGPQGLWFYKPYKNDTLELIQDMFTFKQAESDASLGGATLSPEYIKIQLLNASDDTETFENTKSRLKEKGYNIAQTGETTYSKTTKVINRTEKKEDVIDELINTLGYGNSSTGKTESNYDITVIVGEDMKQLMVATQ
ncbi:MAG: LCP family protein [Clostridia bacterium]|nr:LCP family protein [Clostridia bacterium]